VLPRLQQLDRGLPQPLGPLLVGRVRGVGRRAVRLRRRVQLPAVGQRRRQLAAHAGRLAGFEPAELQQPREQLRRALERQLRPRLPRRQPRVVRRAGHVARRPEVVRQRRVVRVASRQRRLGDRPVRRPQRLDVARLRVGGDQRPDAIVERLEDVVLRAVGADQVLGAQAGQSPAVHRADGRLDHADRDRPRQPPARDRQDLDEPPRRRRQPAQAHPQHVLEVEVRDRVAEPAAPARANRASSPTKNGLPCDSRAIRRAIGSPGASPRWCAARALA
jgi:hypothetical protein